jgi:hypothetical protein
VLQKNCQCIKIKGFEVQAKMKGEVTDWGRTEKDVKDGLRIQGWKDE